MQGLRIYDQLLQFPLFQGMSHDDLEIVAGHIRFGFVKIAAGKQVVSAGDACNQLFFLINGNIKVETTSDDCRYTVVEQFSAPYVLQQEAVFGYYQHYTHSFSTLTDANFLTIEKEEISRLLEDSRLNVSRVLNQLQREGLVELHRGRVVIPQLERLLM